MQRIDIPSKRENIVIVEQLIDKLCKEHNIHDDFYGNILISLTEGVNNAIIHGNKLDPDKDVALHYTVNSDKLSIIIEDQGPGFDYDNLPDPTAPENIERPNGRGVFLMKNLADEVEFKEEGRVIELSFNLKHEEEKVSA